MDLRCQIVLSVVIVVLSAVSCAPPYKIPPNFDLCKLGDGFNQCVARATEKAVKSIAKGYPPLGILPLDPLEIKSIDIAQGDGPVSVNLKFRDILITGMSDMDVLDLKADMDKLIINVKVHFDRVQLKGPYAIDGKYLILSINGDGASDILLEDIQGDVKIVGKRMKKAVNTFMKVTDFSFDMYQTKKMTISLENLFNGNEVLGSNMNRFLNENSLDILKELRPAIEAAFGTAFKEISNKIFTKVPFEEIFPSK